MLLEQKEQLDELPTDPSGNKDDLENAINEELTNELTKAVVEEAVNIVDKDVIEKEASEAGNVYSYLILISPKMKSRNVVQF